jgi:hypothetical protein
MEAIVFDVQGAKNVIVESVKRLYPELIVVDNAGDTDDTAITFYPPSTYYSDLGVDVFVNSGMVEFFMDTDRVAALPLSVDSDNVAMVIKKLIDEEEEARKG